ncbi:hypothetical protein [Sphingomonas sp. SRS2]|uniref:hypothetical protein n=1 Tax=Sphingomonas sp. SRS2 TaxID=133190 RepID=UPI000618467C|nr:hypothetical protein [Sphingomonas sp. SRS2]KKC24556.1 hypothetical protein WP12_18890 [Sphingomonas sp. SRS2]
MTARSKNGATRRDILCEGSRHDPVGERQAAAGMAQPRSPAMAIMRTRVLGAANARGDAPPPPAAGMLATGAGAAPPPPTGPIPDGGTAATPVG